MAEDDHSEDMEGILPVADLEGVQLPHRLRLVEGPNGIQPWWLGYNRGGVQQQWWEVVFPFCEGREQLALLYTTTESYNYLQLKWTSTYTLSTGASSTSIRAQVLGNTVSVNQATISEMHLNNLIPERYWEFP